MKRVPSILLALVLLGAFAVPAFAWHLTGHVFCDASGLPLPNVTISVTTTDGGDLFTGQATTDEFGAYTLSLADSTRCYDASVQLAGGATAVNPASGDVAFCTTDNSFEIVQDFVIASPSCSGACWLTGGGGKFDPIIGLRSGQNGPDDTWGGNVNPGCSPTAGDGGNWNHVAHSRRLHFQGTAIQVVRCGNVDGIPPGSTSPVTPFNFIEFTGTGRLDGIQGNKVSYPLVYFFARCEDRNEPGSAGVDDGTLTDRYFLNVYSNPSDPVGSSLLLVDQDGNPATVDPVLITHGNLQLHISSCVSPAAVAPAPSTSSALMRPATEASPGAASPGAVWFAAPSPSPARSSTLIRFGLPHAANVSLAAYDVGGRRVVTFANGRFEPGQHSFDWALRNENGGRVSAGVYFLRLVVDGTVMSRPIVLQP